MEGSAMNRLLRAGAISAVIALATASASPASATAQGGGGQGAGRGATTDARGTEDTQRRSEDGFDPGWFGLLGLAGLFGLRRPREETTTTRLDAAPVGRRP
jgi:MYXO-CTERM domain-containing protein